MTVLQQSKCHAVRQIQSGLWQIVFHLPATVNCWLWEDSDGLTLIDTGYPWCASTILKAVEQIGKPLSRIAITHAHPDHAGAAAELSDRTGIMTMAHQADIPYLKGQSMAQTPGFWLCRAVLRAGRYAGILDSPSITSVDSITDGEMIGGLQVIQTPGHTPGSSVCGQRNRKPFSVETTFALALACFMSGCHGLLLIRKLKKLAFLAT